ncbi:CCA tRNA nucleotidyltransferase [Lutispora thermophila]|uniref:tRNA nucleotidyltransferase (CCA-adding enzyme) n=1 Tax=Lutispora thermophila DSM 19022 TaxID=1122184 RepID=A0A1M6FH91_9FIRM|nr:HD domain-containing protein [Lutispora thermophila]SHI97104.1 tRNA nucleotidyltransferase (CCA-adding enzyme) [Lutispora thermophila DSM 19022]
MKIDIPHYVRGILDRLIDNGYEAYIVGGCIRDILLKKHPEDWDVTTSALPEEVIKIFNDKTVVNTGEKYGTVTVINGDGKVEVTTFRKEGDYSDGRHPDWVSFGNNIEDDLRRRDFTVNSMAWNPIKGIVDPFGGEEDIAKGTIRTVGNPLHRFSEDGLRMMRAVRFASNLNFTIVDETLEAIKYMAASIKNISMERIREEFFKIIVGTNPKYGLNLLLDTRLMDFILPELLITIGFQQNNPYHDMDVFHHTLCVLEKTPPVLHIRLAALFHDIGKPYCYTEDEEGIGHFYGHNKKSVQIAEQILKRLKSPNKLIRKVSILVEHHMRYYNSNERYEIKKLICEVGKDNIFDLLSLQKADAMCKNKEGLIDNAHNMEKTVKEIISNNEPLCLQDLAINGEDLMKSGLKPGIDMGKALNELLNMVIKNPELNNKETLLTIALNKWLSAKCNERF